MSEDKTTKQILEEELKRRKRTPFYNPEVLQSVRYCDIHGYEVPGLRDYLDSIAPPSICIEHDYSQAALAPLRTRVQAFLEMIDQGKSSRRTGNCLHWPVCSPGTGSPLRPVSSLDSPATWPKHHVAFGIVRYASASAGLPGS
jgi:hypothetical protein